MPRVLCLKKHYNLSTDGPRRRYVLPRLKSRRSNNATRQLVAKLEILLGSPRMRDGNESDTESDGTDTDSIMEDVDQATEHVVLLHHPVFTHFSSVAASRRLLNPP